MLFCDKHQKLLKNLPFFSKKSKFLKEIRLPLPIYIIRRVNNPRQRNGGEFMTYFAKNNIEKEAMINEKQRSNSKNSRGK